MAIYFFTREDLEDALGKQTVANVFSENNSAQASTRAIDACRAYGTAECKSFIRGNYDESILPTTEEALATMPDELKFAALDFGCAYAMRRRPDIVKALGEESWTTFRDSAIEKMKRYCSTLQRLPRTVDVPSNVGATVSTPVTNTNADGETRHKHWEDFGDY